MLSHRNVANTILARCLCFEFEDVVRKIDNVNMLSPGRLSHFDARYRLAARLASHFPIALNPGVQVVTVDREYELFFTACNFPTDLLYVNALKGWRKKCKTAVCWIDEIFVSTLGDVKYFNDIISQFDYVIVSCQQAVNVIERLVRGECRYVLPGIDAEEFCPIPGLPRFIDVLSIGRRSERMHQELVSAAQADKIFYFHDTISYRGCKYGLITAEPKQHRGLLARLAKRSKYFVVNPGKFDEPKTVGQEEVIGPRFFEGAASGTVMIGRKPNNAVFDELFFWPDAVIDIPHESEQVMEILNDLNAQPKRLEKIRKNNMTNSLLNHDWLYRWEQVLELAGLDPMPEFFARRRALESRVRVLKEIEG
jgi:hypothetical protein